MFLLFTLSGYAAGYKGLTTGGWQIRFDDQKGGVSLYKKSKNICEGLYASYLWGEQTVTTRDYARHKVSIRKISDAFGKGTLYKIEHTDKSLPKLTQYFYLYPDKEYILTEFSIEGKNNVASNRMAPVNVDRMAELLPAGDNRALFMPFDNDKWIRYQSHALNFDTLTSYEVTAVFNNEGRSGLVVGSVEHDNWKTAVMLGKVEHRNIGSLTCYGGVADELTRDVKPHGALKGKKIKSPKILLGFFENWCDGLETYAKVNAIISPPKEENISGGEFGANDEVMEKSAGRKTILIAEDIQSNYQLVSTILKDHYDLLHAENGQKAVEIARSQHVDLLLMDMKMPVLDGLKATAEIRKFNASLPIVALTAHAFDSDRIAAIKVGCNEYLVKPLEKMKLMVALKKYL